MWSLSLPALSAPTLVLGTAAGYALATIGMKLTAQDQMPAGLALAIAGFWLPSRPRSC